MEQGGHALLDEVLASRAPRGVEDLDGDRPACVLGHCGAHPIERILNDNTRLVAGRVQARGRAALEHVRHPLVVAPARGEHPEREVLVEELGAGVAPQCRAGAWRNAPAPPDACADVRVLRARDLVAALRFGPHGGGHRLGCRRSSWTSGACRMGAGRLRGRRCCRACRARRGSGGTGRRGRDLVARNLREVLRGVRDLFRFRGELRVGLRHEAGLLGDLFHQVREALGPRSEPS
mmetsp:Transcript_26731/g.84866  ORF Transcript_26731/g.84866 Transcript_26731/m.84866 type:complete len:235 (+) Transcript_26731:645-1349(+)